MHCVLFSLRGEYGHYRRAFANNTPLTHLVPPKTAVLGMVGAVLGIQRETMNARYPEWCSKLMYGIQVMADLQTRPVSFTSENRHPKGVQRGKAADSYFRTWGINKEEILEVKGVAGRAPLSFEMLIRPHYRLVLASLDSALAEHLQAFDEAVRSHQYEYFPTLGLANCPAQLEAEPPARAEQLQGTYQTRGVIRELPKVIDPERAYRHDEIAVQCAGDRWVKQSHYQRVYFATNGGTIPDQAQGDYLVVTPEGQPSQCWTLL